LINLVTAQLLLKDADILAELLLCAVHTKINDEKDVKEALEECRDRVRSDQPEEAFALC
jgi:hypothetical protein